MNAFTYFPHVVFVGGLRRRILTPKQDTGMLARPATERKFQGWGTRSGGLPTYIKSASEWRRVYYPVVSEPGIRITKENKFSALIFGNEGQSFA